MKTKQSKAKKEASHRSQWKVNVSEHLLVNCKVSDISIESGCEEDPHFRSTASKGVFQGRRELVPEQNYHQPRTEFSLPLSGELRTHVQAPGKPQIETALPSGGMSYAFSSPFHNVFVSQHTSPIRLWQFGSSVAQTTRVATFELCLFALHDSKDSPTLRYGYRSLLSGGPRWCTLRAALSSEVDSLLMRASE